jgi:hypothetical protein
VDLAQESHTTDIQSYSQKFLLWPWQNPGPTQLPPHATHCQKKMENELLGKFSECDAIFAKLTDNPHKELLVSVQVTD